MYALVCSLPRLNHVSRCSYYCSAVALIQPSLHSYIASGCYEALPLPLRLSSGTQAGKLDSRAQGIEGPSCSLLTATRLHTGTSSCVLSTLFSCSRSYWSPDDTTHETSDRSYYTDVTSLRVSSGYVSCVRESIILPSGLHHRLHPWKYKLEAANRESL